MTSLKIQISLAAAALAFLLWGSLPAEAQDLAIGSILQLTGTGSEWGAQAREGADLAAEVVNASNLLGGRKLRLIYEDGQGIPAVSVTALQRLVSLNHIPAFITQASAVSVTLAPLSNRERIVQVDVGSVTPAYRQAHDFTFRTAVTALQLATGLADTLVHDKLTDCGILYVNDDYGLGIKDVFSKRFRELGGKLKAEQSFLPGDADFKAQLLQLRKESPPAIVFAARYEPMATILKQARQLGIGSRFYGDSYSIESEQVLADAGAAAEGFTYVAPRYDMRASPTAAGFTDRFRKKYRKAPVQLSAQAYDGVLALAYAAAKCKEAAGSCIREQIEHIGFDGASGPVEFDETGDVKSREVTVKVVKNGHPVERK